MQKSEFHERYEVIKRLGKGQFAVVYEVIEKLTDIHWAAKVVNKDHCPASALECELAILKMVSHPNAVTFKEVFNTEDSCIIVMELVTGGELFDRISEQGVFTEQNASKFFRELLLVVKHLHDKNIVHRDLKPENILLSDASEGAVLKVIDFGISKIAMNDKALLGSCGTLPYMAPEIFSHSSYGRPIDVWALGVILYIILAGLFPYDPDDRKFDCPFLSPEFDEISDSAKDILLKLMDKNPDTRFTVDQALRHPWVTGEAASNTAITVDNLRQLVAKKKFKRAAETIRTGLRLRGIVMRRKVDANAVPQEKPLEAAEKEKPKKSVPSQLVKAVADLDNAEKLIKSALEQLDVLSKSGNLPKEDLEGMAQKLGDAQHALHVQFCQLKVWEMDINDEK